MEFLSDLTSGQLLGVGLVVLSAVLYVKHINEAKNREPSKFRLQAGYSRLSPFKHDVWKGLTAEIIPILLLSRNAESLLSFDNFFESLAGRIVLIFAYYLVFYHLVEPYIADETPVF